jgi:hypothetical protein
LPNSETGFSKQNAKQGEGIGAPLRCSGGLYAIAAAAGCRCHPLPDFGVPIKAKFEKLLPRSPCKILIMIQL